MACSGSAGASPSQSADHRTWEGEPPVRCDGLFRLSRSFALPKLGHRTREGEPPGEPRWPVPAQQELRPPKNWTTEPGRASLPCAVMACSGSAGASPSQNWATELGRASLLASRDGLFRLSRSFALPKFGPPNLGGRASRPRRDGLFRLSRSFALPKIGPPNLGGRASRCAAMACSGSAGASPSQKRGPPNLGGRASPSRNHARPFRSAIIVRVLQGRPAWPGPS